MHFVHPLRLARLLPILAVSAVLSLLATPLFAQTVYAVGGPLNAGACPATFTTIYTVSPTTGAATSVGTSSFSSVALAVSPADGQVYYLEQTVAGPRLAKWNPVGGTNTTVGTTALPGTMIRMGFAPDGKLYAATNTAVIYEINPATGATVRTINTNISIGGSGDLAFSGNGDLYVVANDTVATNPYQLWKLTAAQIAAGGTQTASTVGANLGIGSAIAPNGLTEIPATGTCTGPCFMMSAGATNITYLVNGTTGAATPLGGTGTTGACLTDLGRAYSTTFSITKSDSRTSVQTGDTVNYAIVVTNTGAATTPFTTIQDALPVAPAPTLNCTSLTCTAAGGAVCPATLTVPLLTGAGVVTGVMPIASSVTLNLTCTVN